MAWTPSNEDTPAVRKAIFVARRAGFHLICQVTDGANKGMFCSEGLVFFVVQYAPTQSLATLSNAEAIALLFAYGNTLP